MAFADLTATAIAWGIGIGLLMFVASAVAGIAVVVYLPATYFTGERSAWSKLHPLLHWTVVIGKNLLGVVLIVLGIIMLVLPGQGVLTIIIGILLLSFPGKRQFVAQLIRWTHALPAMNRLRSQFGRQPLELRSDARV